MITMHIVLVGYRRGVGADPSVGGERASPGTGLMAVPVSECGAILPRSTQQRPVKVNTRLNDSTIECTEHIVNNTRQATTAQSCQCSGQH